MKNKVFKLSLSVVLITMLSAFSLFQDDDNKIREIIYDLEKYYNWYPQQKAYLHIDKSNYNVDETLWFKAYLVNASTHRPDSLSTNLYVDLINPAGHIVQSRLLELEEGMAHGDFSFQDTIPEGLYRLRAYTNWMKNVGEDFFFTKDVYVSNPFFETYATRHEVQNLKKSKRKNARNQKRYEVKFLPEGGDLIAGVENVVAFKAVNELGQSIKVEGDLEDNKGNHILNFRSEHEGMGFFSFTPREDLKYEATVRSEGLKEKTVDLPEPLNTGIVLHTDHLGKDVIDVELLWNFEDGSFPANPGFYLLAHSRGVTGYTARADIREEEISFSIPKSNFKSGVVHLTLFNHRLQPVRERLVFIHNDDQLKMQLTPTSSSLDKREQVSLNITVSDKEGYPVEGDFSLSVAQQQPGFPVDNIYSNLLLNSDIKGTVENAGYYFDNFNPEKARQLDLVMLTNGWRRFEWQTVMMDEKMIPDFHIEDGIEITGRITRELFALPLKDIKVTLTILNQFNDIFTTRSGEKGYFSFTGLEYPDTISAKLEAVKENGRKNLVIVLNTRSSKQMEDMNYHSDLFLKKPGTEGKWQNLEAEVPEEEDPFAEENNSYYRIHQEPNDVIIVDESMHNYSNVAQIIQGRVPGVNVTGNDIIIRGVNTFYASTDPLFLVDGVPVDKEYALSINPYDIDRIEVIKGPEAAIYGSRGANGAIAIYTKRGKFMIKGELNFKMLGYYEPKEYYSPRYDIREDNEFEDDRTTLFWEPNLKTDPDGKALVKFWTSDLEGKYNITLEGKNQRGEIGSESVEIEIK